MIYRNKNIKSTIYKNYMEQILLKFSINKLNNDIN